MSPEQQLLLGIILACVAVIILLVAIILFIKLRNKKPKIKIDEEFTNNIIALLGDKDNIKAITVDNGRLKFELDNLDKANLNGLKELSTAGVFVTGSTVKVLFKLESMDIKKAIEAKLK